MRTRDTSLLVSSLGWGVVMERMFVSVVGVGLILALAFSRDDGKDGVWCFHWWFSAVYYFFVLVPSAVIHLTLPSRSFHLPVIQNSSRAEQIIHSQAAPPHTFSSKPTFLSHE